MGRKPRQTQGWDTNTKDRLLTAAYKEFEEKGYYLTNGDSITKRAGLGHGTFYIYFKSKNEVLIELLRRSTNAIPYMAYRNDPTYLMRHAGSPDRFEAALMEMVDPLYDIPGLLKALFQGMLQDQEIIAFGMRIGRDLARMFRVIIRERQKEGELKGCDARILSEVMAVCLSTSILLTAARIIACGPEVLIHNLCAMLVPVIFPCGQRGKTTRLRVAGLENDKKIRREILRAAQEEFIAHGYFETKIAHIMKRSGYSRRTFYHYYKSKDELLKALFFDMLGSLYPQTSVQYTLIEAIDVASIEDWVRLLDQVMQTFDTPINWAFLQGFFNNPDLARVYNDIFAFYSEPIMKQIVAFQARGQLRGLDPKVAAYIIVATVSYTAFLRTAGFLEGSMRKCALNLGWFLYYFFNQRPS